jgi:hypothetical protein
LQGDGGMQWHHVAGGQQYLAQPGSPQSLRTATPTPTAAALQAQVLDDGNQGAAGDLQHGRL